jgi:hypothetical protein
MLRRIISCAVVALASSQLLTPRCPAAESIAQGTLSGTLVDSEGKLIRDALVWLPEYNDADDLVPLVKTRSDEQGRFQLGPSDPCYRHWCGLFIEATGFPAYHVPEHECSIYPDRDHDLGTIRLPAGRVFSGQLLDHDGKPRAGETVKCVLYRHSLAHQLLQISPHYTLTTDSQGRFTTPSIGVGKLSIWAEVPDRQQPGLSVPVIPGGEETLTPLVLKPDVPISGTVRDDSGRPIAGATIDASPGERKVVTDEQGRFILRGYGPEVFSKMWISKSGYATRTVVVRSTEGGLKWAELSPKPEYTVGKEIALVLPRPAWIEGRVIDADTGVPVRLKEVVLCICTRSSDGSFQTSGCARAEFEQPEPGQFRVPYAKASEYHLTFSAPGYDDAELFTRPIANIQPLTGHVVKMKRSGSAAVDDNYAQQITGRVTRDGRPIDRAWVALCTVDKHLDFATAFITRGRVTVSPLRAHQSSLIRDGAFALDVPNPSKDWYLTVEEPGHAPTQVGPITVGAGEHKQLDLACIPGGSIQGHVENVPKEWQGDLWVVAFTNTSLHVEAPVNKDGAFSLQNVPPGVYALKVGHNAFTDSEAPKPPEDLPKEEQLKLIPDPWSRAQTVHVEPGKAVTDVRLQVPDR